ncbi:golgin-84 isoform X2 [Teleopsis dalmanni]|uniref:golgin-84 isoform X2 n=1 Tax=Teleopsis dalmanni TaxID=139649 RepID=UPI0018CE0387|nr:golgin-84 isoform X2 [Teleopsis dalmanni]
MSWISDIVGKAENILVKVDENVATALLQPVNKHISESAQSLMSLSPIKINIPSNKANEEINIGAATFSNASLPYDVDEKFQLTIGKSSDDATAVTININNDVDHNQLPTSLVPEKDMSINSMSGFIQPPITAIEHTKLLTEATVTSSMNAEESELHRRIQELDNLTERLTEERDQAQQRLYECEKTSAAYLHSMSQLESNLAKLQQDCFDASEKMQIQVKETQKYEQELQEYRIKAQRALLNKDNLIAELKSKGLTSSNDGLGVSTEIRALQMEYEALKQSHTQALVEQQKLLMQLEEARKDLNMFNQTNTEQLKLLHENEEALRKELRTEREKILTYESEQRVLTQEMNSLRQQLSNQLAATATRLQTKEMELAQLRSEKLNYKNVGTVSTEDYNKVKTLTQALVDKQNTLEDITADRNALKIQLEKIQDKLQQEICKSNIYKNAMRSPLISNSTDDAKAQFPSLMRESPFDRSVARRMKRAYTTLDSAGIRLGAFLRRYPLIRIFVLLYVGLLHIWVVFVLLSSTPNN